MQKSIEFRPKGKAGRFLASLALCYGILLYLLLSLPLDLTLAICCGVIALFVTVTLGMYHRALNERRLSLGVHGVKINRGKRFLHIPWSHISGVKEAWVGYGRERHRRFYIITTGEETLELMRDDEYVNPDYIVGLINSYQREAARS